MNEHFALPNQGEGRLHVEDIVSERKLEGRLEEFRDVTTVFFDVTGTLCANDDYEARHPKALTESLANHHGVAVSDAEQMIKDKTAELSQIHPHVSKSQVVQELGVPRPVFQRALNEIDPGEYFSVDEGLVSLIQALRAKFSLGIISNVPREHNVNLLRTLGLNPEDFSYVVTGDDVERSKPYPDAFEKALEVSGQEASMCLYIGDSPSKDMAPAHDVGMKTILIKAVPTEKDIKDADAYIGQITELNLLAGN